MRFLCMCACACSYVYIWCVPEMFLCGMCLKLQMKMQKKAIVLVYKWRLVVFFSAPNRRWKKNKKYHQQVDFLFISLITQNKSLGAIGMLSLAITILNVVLIIFVNNFVNPKIIVWLGYLYFASNCIVVDVEMEFLILYACSSLHKFDNGILFCNLC